MASIQIPRRATVGESYHLIEACSKAEAERGEVELDRSHVRMFGPPGVGLLAASIAVRRLAGRATSLRLPDNPDARDFVQDIALDRFARGERTGLGTLEIRQMQGLDPTYTGNVVEMLIRGVPGMTEEKSYTIELCLNELLQNVFEWSKSPIGCTVMARWYRKTQSVRLAVIDRGVGIPAALRSKKIRGLHRATDAEVIEAAVTTPRLTSRENLIGGFGLKTIRETVCERRGRLTIILAQGQAVVVGGASVSVPKCCAQGHGRRDRLPSDRVRG